MTTNVVKLDIMTTPQMEVREVKTRHGTFSIYDEDELVGLSLATYGEYSEGEVDVFRKVLRPGDEVIDVGANIGALTIPMARFVDEGGMVHAFEASDANVHLLQQNIDQNSLRDRIMVWPFAASDHSGYLPVSKQDALHAYCRSDINQGNFEVRCITIDSLGLKKVKLIKIDVDRHELQVLRGAEKTIERCRPVIYIENECDDLREQLVAWLVDHGYRLYWHRPYLFNADNWRGEKRNIFGTLVSIMNLCVPEDAGYEVLALEEVSDYRDDDRIFDREFCRHLERIKRNPDDLQSRWMAAHHANLMQRGIIAFHLIARNLEINPKHVPTLALRALMHLQDGHYDKEGWEGYEIRHQQPNRHQFGGDRHHSVERWNGEPTDEPVLIWTEQGFGDNIMFVRFIKEVIERAPNAVLECRPELYELFKYSFEYSGMVPRDRLYRLGRWLPDYQRHLPLASVPWALGADRKMIAHRNAGYLKVDPTLISNWRGTGRIRLGQTPDPLCGARIGLCDKGSATSERPYTRDVPKPLLANLVRKYGPVFPLHQQGQFDSFFMTAAAIMALDLVITVDTSVAHLAGALGKETWLLLSFDPDFRWGLHGDKTIWYDSVRIFRQPKLRDWKSVIDEVEHELENRANESLHCTAGSCDSTKDDSTSADDLRRAACHEQALGDHDAER